MSFKQVKSTEWSSSYQWIDIPNSSQDVKHPDELIKDASGADKEKKEKISKTTIKKRAQTTEKNTSIKPKETLKKKAESPKKKTPIMKPKDNIEELKVPIELPNTIHEDINFTIPKADLPTFVDLENLNKQRGDIVIAKSIKKGPETSFKIRPDPILRLKKLMGISYNACPYIQFNKNPKRSDEFLFTCGNVLVHMQSENHSQRFSSLDYSLPNGELPNIVRIVISSTILFTVDSNYSITLWDNNLSNDSILTFTPPLIKITAIAITKEEKFIVVGGKDQYKRDMLIVYKLNVMIKQKKIEVEARQLSDFDIGCIEWNPNTEGNFVSCGKENVYFWVIKRGSIPGKLAIFQQPLKGKRFVGIDYLRPGVCTHVIAATECGSIFKIKISNRAVEQVIRIADSIGSFLTFNEAISEGSICPFWGISSGKVFRLWDSVRNIQLLEHSMEGIIINFCFNLYGDKVALLDDLGNVGMIKLESKVYEVIVRSHTDSLIDFDFSQPANVLVTGSKDGTIRAWSLNQFVQTTEFSISQDQLTGLACSGNDAVCACAFVSGSIRILDLASSKLFTCSGTSHKVGSNLKRICYSKDGSTLATIDAYGKILLLDARERRYEVFKVIEVDNAIANYLDIDFSPDGDLLGHIGSNANVVCLWETMNYSLKYSLDCTGEIISKMRFSDNCKDLLLLTVTSKIKFFRIDSLKQRCYQTMEAPGLHALECTNFCISSNFNFILTCSKDYSIKVFDYMMRGDVLPTFQGFLGHQSFPTKILLSPNGNKCLVSISSETNFIHLWDFFISSSEPPTTTLNAMKDETYQRKDEAQDEEIKAGSIAEAKLWVPPELMELPSTTREVYGEVVDDDDITLVNKSLVPQYVIGYNSTGYKNLVWNESKWFAYTSTNKLVIELLKHTTPETRKQFFISFGKDKMESLTLSNNKKYIAVYNRYSKTESTSIYAIDTQTWKVLSHITILHPIIYSVGFSLNNNLLMVLSGNGIESALHFYDHLAPELLVRSVLSEPMTNAEWNSFSSSGLEFITSNSQTYEFWLLNPELTLQYQEGKLLNKSAPLTALTFTEPFIGLSSIFLIVAKEDGTIDLINTKTNTPIASIALAKKRIDLIEWKQKRLIFTTNDQSISSVSIDSQE